MPPDEKWSDGHMQLCDSRQYSTNSIINSSFFSQIKLGMFECVHKFRVEIRVESIIITEIE